MDELSILRARVTILERQMVLIHTQLREFLWGLRPAIAPDLDFGPVGAGGRLFASGPAEEEKDEVEESTEESTSMAE